MKISIVRDTSSKVLGLQRGHLVGSGVLSDCTHAHTNGGGRIYGGFMGGGHRLTQSLVSGQVNEGS